MKWGYGWLCLLYIYGYGLSTINVQLFSTKSLMVNISVYFFLLGCYYWLRRLFINKNYFGSNVLIASFLSGVVVVGIFVGFIDYSQRTISGHEDVNQYIRNFNESRKILHEEELKYSEFIREHQKTATGIEYQLKRLEISKNFINREKALYGNLVTFFRQMNLKYKHDNDDINKEINKFNDDLNMSFKNVDESITSLACYYSNHNEDCHKRYKEFVAKQAGLNVKLNEDQKKIIRLID